MRERGRARPSPFFSFRAAPLYTAAVRVPRLLAVALLPLAVSCHDRTAAPSTKGEGTRVLVIGLDGADWEILDRLSAEGRLPNLTRLWSEGARGVLRSENPLLSPIVWTSIATGRGAEDHGIVGFLTVRNGVEEPVRSDERRVRAFWNVATDHHRSVGVIGWYASWPAEPVDGFLVSDRVGSHQIQGEAGRAKTGLAYPEELVPEIESLRGEVEREVGPRELSRFFSAGTEGGAQVRVETEKLQTFLGIVRTTELYRRLAPLLLDRFRPTIGAVYFEGTDAVGHLFSEYQPPRLPWVGEADVEHLGSAWDRYYTWIDTIVGEIVAKVDPARTTVLVVSDHGFKVGARRPHLADESKYGNQAPQSHREEGILIAWGEGVRHGARLPESSVYDVLPTMFRLADVPLAENLRGRPIDAAFEPGAVAGTVRTVPDYETGERVRGDAGEAPADDTIAKLRALGYVGGGPGEKVAEGGPSEGQAAVPLNRYNMALILSNRGKFDESLEVLRQVQRDVPTFSLGWVGEGMVRLREGKPEEAIAPLEKAVRMAPDLGTALSYLGEAYLKAGRSSDAARIFEKTLAHNPADARTALLLAQILVRNGKTAESERWYRAAFELAEDPTDRARGAVGLAIVAEERRRLDDAARRYEEALRLSPDLPGALERFGNLRLYQKRNDDAVALFRRLVDVTGEDPRTLVLYGRALAIAGRNGEARTALDRALAKDPGLGEARDLLRRLPASS